MAWRTELQRLTNDLRGLAEKKVDFAVLESSGPAEWRRVLAPTPLAAADVHLQAKQSQLVLAYSVLVAKAAVEAAIEQVEDPLLLAAAASRLVESAMHTFIDPRTGRTHRHLAASKQSGSFFTPTDVAVRMADAVLGEHRHRQRVLDPAAGVGALLAAVIVRAADRGVSVADIEGWELSPLLADLCESVLMAVGDRVGLQADIRVVACDALESFDDNLAAGGRRFDAVILNPPYGRLKFLRSSLTNTETRVADVAAAERRARTRVRAERARTKRLAQRLSVGGGTPDYQRLFVAGSYRLLSEDGRLVVISPSSWTTGKDAADLRELLLGSGSLRQLVLYPEGCHLFPTVNQPTAVAVFDRSSPADAFDVRRVDPGTRAPLPGYPVAYTDLDAAGPNPSRIPLVDPSLQPAYRHLAQAPKLGSLPWLKNARGELDVTLDKGLVADRPTPTRLVRGDHIERHALREASDSSRSGYLRPTGLAIIAQRPKGADIGRPRVAGRQCSYMGKGRRLSFTMVPAGVVLANSCNYLCLRDGGSDEDLFALAVVVNSAAAEWWFRVHSSNNHVSNYEIADLPCPPPHTDVWAALAVVGRQLQSAYAGLGFGESKTGSPLEDLADALVCFGLGLAAPCCAAVLAAIAPERAQRVAGIVAWLARHGLPGSLTRPVPWPQHEEPTLSTRDREMVGHVPQGGNWQDIPESVPSQRLAQIRSMTAERGLVRTTYYGRLRPDQPAYTVSTYFNRPGNGTNIHPHEDRTLTAREAARLQSFPDTYTFLGSDGAVRKQVGNAVPPLLAYAVGSQLLDAGYDGPVVDLFAGAGGLSLGLEWAGANVVAAVDNDLACEQTYTFNRRCEPVGDPDSGASLFIRADLSDAHQRETALAAIEQKLAGRRPAALVGGPPCQGFSHAGFRGKDDHRNDLAAVFLEFARVLRPEAVVLENVEGLLTYRKGRTTIGDLRRTLRELGYDVGEPWLLLAERYGVPQMRRRVFVVATRGREVEAPAPVLDQCRGRRERRDPPSATPTYPVTVAEALLGLPDLGRVSHPSVGDRRVRTAYARWTAGLLPTERLLAQLRASRTDESPRR